MSPAPIVKSSRMPKSDANREAAHRRFIMGVYEAIRVGRLRVVDPPRTKGFQPRMEICDDPDLPEIFATFELPGVKNSDVRISMQEETLFIQGIRHPRNHSRRHPSVRALPQAETGEMEEVDSPQVSQARARIFPSDELRYGPFRRAIRIRLPPGADMSCINARLSDGLLTVSWPRSTQAATIQEHSAVERQTSSVRADPHGTTNLHSRVSE